MTTPNPIDVFVLGLSLTAGIGLGVALTIGVVGLAIHGSNWLHEEAAFRRVQRQGAEERLEFQRKQQRRAESAAA